MFEIVEKLMTAKGITAYRLAKDTGVDPATLTNWKQGKYIPKTDKIQKIADYFGVPIDYILTGRQPDGYYMNDEVAEIAQAVYDRPELKVLFDTSRKSTKEDIEQAISMLDYLYRKEHPEDD